eukprot:Tbor_TRINITY_DN5270_c0_g2::TRINITY_DN5270_c0_g2_i1::g.16771::m.16771
MSIFSVFLEKPAVKVKDALFLCFFYPVFASISVVFSIYALIFTHSVAVGSHVLDFIKEWIPQKFRNKTRGKKERVESLLKQVMLAIRMFLLSILLFSFHMTAVAFFLSIWSIFNAVVRKDDSVLGCVIRGVINRFSLVLFGVPLTAFGFKGRSPDSTNASSGERRTTSLKSSNKCRVTDEGPHFNRTARGFIGKRSA